MATMSKFHEMDPTIPYWWKFGRPAEVWLNYREQFERFIKKNKIKPLDPEAYPENVAYSRMSTISPDVKRAAEELRIWPKPYPGGIKVPHLHYGSDVYLLTRKQWKEVSAVVMEDVAQRVTKTDTISFDKFIGLTEATLDL